MTLDRTRPASLQPDIQQSSLLIVDDRAQNRTAVRAILEPIDVRIVEASSGDDALRNLLTEDFTLILLDVDMPEMNGFQTAELVKRHPRTANTPIIFLTAHDDLRDRASEGYGFGAVDYIAKPFDPNVLRAKVRVFLELHHKSALLERQTRQLEDHVEQLRMSRSALADAQRIANLGSWEYDPKTGRLRGSRQFHEIFGEPPDVPLPPASALFERLTFRPNGVSGDILMHSTTPANFDGELIRGDGVRRHVVVHAEPKSDTLTIIGTVQDVTDQREAQRAVDDLTHQLHRERELLHIFQQTVVAPPVDVDPGVHISYCYRPADAAVGGDFYDVLPVDGGILLVIGDVAGHGLGAASLMSEIRTALRTASIHVSQPSRLIEEVDRYVARFHPGAFATMLVIRFDPETGVCTMACAGHVPPLAVGAGHDDVKWALGEPPLGAGRAERNETSFVLDHGQSLLLYTDGLVERRGELVDDGIDRVRHALARFEPDRSSLAGDVVQAVCGDAELKDDVAALALHRRAYSTTLDIMRVARVSEVAVVRRLVRRWLRSFRADPECIDDIVLAVCELVANACVHAYRVGVDGQFSVHGDIAGDSVSFVVRDSGHWRDGGGTGGGRGLKMANALVRQLSVDATENGTSVVITADLHANDRGREQVCEQ